MTDIESLAKHIEELIESRCRIALAMHQHALAEALRARPIADYHEDMGPVLWWKFPVEEPPYVGTPNDVGREMLITTTVYTIAQGEHEPYRGAKQQRINVGGWPGYHTHFTPIPVPKEPT